MSSPMNLKNPKLRIEFQNSLIDNMIISTCTNCEDWNREAEVCRRFSNSRPPARVIVTGCEYHQFDIPF
jgi:hypothetical protein